MSTDPMYASVPSKVLLNNLFRPKANPKILLNISPKIRKVKAIIAMFLSNIIIVIKAANKNSVIEDNFFDSPFLNNDFTFTVSNSFVCLFKNLKISSPKKHMNTIPKMIRVKNLEYAK